jgi:hypothetical protein
MAIQTNGTAQNGTVRQRKAGEKNGDTFHTTSEEGKRVDALLDQHSS